jgi:carbon monoxide dehydrogenase subunit G
VKIEGSYTLEAPRDVVWEAVLDPDVLARTIPGGQDLEVIGEHQFSGKMKIRIGPVQGVFNGTVNLTDLQPPESYHIEMDGKGAPGFVRGEGELRLEEQGDATILHYSGDAQVGGRLASVGQRLMESSGQALIRQSLEALNAQIAAKMSGESGEEIAPPEAPSEVQFAAGVTKKMIEDMIPPEQRPELMRNGAIVAGLVLLMWLVTNWWTNRLASKVADNLAKRR